MINRCYFYIILTNIVVFLPCNTCHKSFAANIEKKVSLYAVIVGYNQSHDNSGITLQFADDDAVKNYQLMKQFGADAVLLTELDEMSKKLYSPSINLLPPSLSSLHSALLKINIDILNDRKHGKETRLYFMYTGHGGIQSGEGYVELKGQRLTRTRLRKLLKTSKADINHVIIDSCKSFFLIFERGPGGNRGPIIKPLMSMGEYPLKNVGFILSTSSMQISHEWEAYEGGIFSHEIRSAMRGAADLNLDGRVTYEEAGAFIYTANVDIPHVKYRPQFFIMPPKGQSAQNTILSDLHSADGKRVFFSSTQHQHYFIETSNGIRIADLHPQGTPVEVVLPKDDKLFVRQHEMQIEYEIPDQSPVSLISIASHKSRALARGSEHEAFRSLFKTPFNQDALRKYRLRPPLTIEIAEEHNLPRWIRPGIGVIGLMGMTTGAIFTGLAIHEKGQSTASTPFLERQRLNRNIHQYNIISLINYIVGGALCAGYLTWSLMPERKITIQLSPSLSEPVGMNAQVPY